jgi:hypothetical protein
MVYQHLPNPSGHTPDRMAAKPRRSRRDEELPASQEGTDRRDRPGAIGLIAGRLMRVFRTHS